MTAPPRTIKMPPMTTRLLSKDSAEQTVNDTSIFSNTKPPFSAILLGSPGEMVLDEHVSAKTSKNGMQSGLQGVLRDLMLARAFFIHNSHSIFECMHGMRLFKSEVLGAMMMFFQQEHQPNHFVVYFSGHGNKQTGNWVFTDGEVSLNDIYELFIQVAPRESILSIVADCCHSGAWVEQLFTFPEDYDKTRVAIQAACLKEEVCWDTTVGGMFTKSWVSGAYHRLSQRQVRQHRGQENLDMMQSNLNKSIRTWLPWQGFLSNNPGLLACSLWGATSVHACSNECSSRVADADLEHAQHPIASAPFVFNLTFHDERFRSLDESRRFPQDKQFSSRFIDLQDFWLGRSLAQ